MAQIGTVKEISGVAQAVNANGTTRVLVLGDPIFEGDVVTAVGSDSSIKLSFDSGRELDLNGGEKSLIDQSVYANEGFQNADVTAEQQALLDGGALPDAATAAGQQGPTSDGGFRPAFIGTNSGDLGDVSSHNLGTDGRGSTGPNADQAGLINQAPIGVDDVGVAVEEGAGGEGQYDAPVVSVGNVLTNDTDDGLPNPAGDLDVSGVTSGNEPTNLAVLDADGNYTLVGEFGTLVLNAETGAYTYTVDDANPTVNAQNINDTLTEDFTYTVTDGLLNDTANLTITINGANDAPIAFNDRTGDISGATVVQGEIVPRGTYDSNNQGEYIQSERGSISSQESQGISIDAWSFTHNGGQLNIDILTERGGRDWIDINNDGNQSNLDSYIHVYSVDNNGNRTSYLRSNDDDDLDNGNDGSTDDYDSFLNLGNLPAGNYVIEISDYHFDRSEIGQTYQSDQTGNPGAYQITFNGDVTVTSVPELGKIVTSGNAISSGNNAQEEGTGNETSATEAAIVATGNVLNNDTDVDNQHDQLTVTNVDETTVAISGDTIIEGQFGTLTMHADGSFSYSADDANVNVNGLNIGESINDVFTYTVSDNEEFGAKTDTATLTITIDGSNDAPVISIDRGDSIRGTIVEDAPHIINEEPLFEGLKSKGKTSHNSESTSGTIAFNDVDVHDSHRVTYALKSVDYNSNNDALDNTYDVSNPDSEYSQFGINPLDLFSAYQTRGGHQPGDINWNFSVANATLQPLAEGETVDLVYTITVTDLNGKTDTQDVTITITGTNDDVLISSADSTGDVVEDGAAQAVGTVGFTDVDLTDDHSVTSDRNVQQGDYSVTMGTFTATETADTTGTGTGGVVSWTYDINNAAAQELAAGQTVTETYTITINDNNGDTVTQDVTITITGTNDDVIIEHAIDSGHVQEDRFFDSITAGPIHYSDVDLTDTHDISFTRSAQPSDYNQTMGTFEIVGNIENSTDGLTGWKYTIDNSTAQELAYGQSVYETYTITIDDGNGGETTQDVIIEIKGTNDRPVSQDVTETVTEGSLVADSSGHVNAVYTGAFDYSDVDLTDTHTVNLQDVQTSNGHWAGWFNWVPAEYAPMVITGNATDIINIADTDIVVDGDNFSVTNPHFNNLGVNDSVTITFNYNVTDSSTRWNDTSGTDTVSITITGTNDVPVVHAITVPTTNEDAAAFDIPLLDPSKVSDVDTHDNLDVQDVTVVSNDGHTVMFSVDSDTGLLTIDPDQFTYLADDESVNLTVNYNVNDGTVLVANTATVTIEGRNDAPVITAGTNTADLTETDTTLTASGDFTVTDVDTTDVVTASVESIALSGTNHADATLPDSSALQAMLTVNPTAIIDGTETSNTLSWNFDSNGEAFDYLAVGETLELTYTVKATDDSGIPLSGTNTVKVTITGTNDQPVVQNVNVGMIVSENFENGATGWVNNLGTDNLVTNGGELTNFLGRFGGTASATSGDEEVSKTFVFGAEYAGQTVTVDFDMYEIDSWDGASGWNNESPVEAFQVFVNGSQVSSDTMQWNIAESGQTTTSQNEFTGWGGEGMHHYSITATVDANGELKLGFGSTLHQSVGDESWGIDNLQIVAGQTIYEVDSGRNIFNGILNVSDDDTTDTHIYNLVAGSVEVNGVDTPNLIIVNQDGHYTMSGDFNYLAAGETATVTFQYIADDQNGFDGTDGVNENSLSEPKTVTITITGTDDAPVFTSQSNANVIESFENLITSDNSWTIITNPSFTGDHGTQWQTAGGNHGLEVQSGNTGDSTASDGNVHAELDSNDLVKMTTTVNIAEDNSTLTFDYKPRPGYESDSDMKISLGDSHFTINSNGNITDTSTGLDTPTVTTNDSGWISVTVHLPVTANADTDLSFEGLGDSDSFGAYLDNISLIGGIDNTDSNATYNTLAISDVDGGVIDLSSVGTDFDKIELSGDVDLNLSVSDVFGLTDGDHELTITGNSNSNVNIDTTTWTANETDANGNNVFEATYNGDNVTLHIETDITTVI